MRSTTRTQRRFAAIAALISAPAFLLDSAPLPASAAEPPPCLSDPHLVASSVTPAVVTLLPNVGVQTNFTAKVDDCPGVTAMEVYFNLSGPAGTVAASRHYDEATHVWSASQLWDPYNTAIDSSRLAGDWSVTLKVVSIRDSFFEMYTHWLPAPALKVSIRLASTLTAQASSTRAVAGSSVAFTGLLAQANPKTHGWDPSGSRPVNLQFKAPAGSYSTVASGTSDSAGRVTISTKVNAPGCWRYTYAGDGKVAAVNGKETCVDVPRTSRVSAQAPKTVKKKKTLTVNGVLTRVDWNTGTYSGYQEQTVDLTFRNSAGAVTKVKSVKTGAGGKAAVSLTASKDGCYRFVYAGNSTTAASSSPDACTDVT